MAGGKSFNSDWAGLLLPSLAAEAGAQFFRQMADAFAPSEPRVSLEPAWASENEIVLELSSSRLRRFGAGAGTPLLVCAPFALHGAGIADLCPGHSLMEVLRAADAPLYLVEWRSAAVEQAGRRIDDYLADLNVLFDELGGAVDFIGLCQGGWLGLIYAARFPGRIGRLVVAGSPVDITAGESSFSRLAQSTSMTAFRDLVAMGGGLARGGQVAQLWRRQPDSPTELHHLLQSFEDCESAAFLACAEAFRNWNARTLDLPGAYYLEVAEHFYKNNALARGDFVALGKRIDLRALRNPLFLLAARDDEVTAPAQTLACAGLVGSPGEDIVCRTAPGGHLSLFLGAQNLREVWPEILAWLRPEQGQARQKRRRRSKP